MCISKKLFQNTKKFYFKLGGRSSSQNIINAYDLLNYINSLENNKFYGIYKDKAITLLTKEKVLPLTEIKKVFDTKIHNYNYLSETDWCKEQKYIDKEIANILEIIKQELLEE